MAEGFVKIVKERERIKGPKQVDSDTGTFHSL